MVSSHFMNLPRNCETGSSLVCDISGPVISSFCRRGKKTVVNSIEYGGCITFNTYNSKSIILLVTFCVYHVPLLQNI